VLLCSGDGEAKCAKHHREQGLFIVQVFKLSVKHAQSASFMGGLGRLLDRGINKLISGGDLPPSGPASNGSEADPLGMLRRAASESGSPSVRPEQQLKNRWLTCKLCCWPPRLLCSRQGSAWKSQSFSCSVPPHMTRLCAADNLSCSLDLLAAEKGWCVCV
jgi:hypothetical protein